MKKKVVIYCRVSSDEQKKRDSIEGQIDTLKTYLDLNKDKYELKGEYLDNGVSGTIPFALREGGKQLIEDATNKHNFDTILVYRIDRFGRDTRTGLNAIEEITKTGIEIQSLSEPFDLNTPTGRFQFIMYLNMAELERNNILDRMFVGATRAAKQGRWLGGKTPYGYKIEKKYLVVNEYEANVIRYIYYLYNYEGKNSLEIAVYLNSMDIKKENKTRSNVWNINMVLRILKNEMYTGTYKYGVTSKKRKEVIERKVPIIIPKYIFDNAQKRLKDNKLIKDTGVAKRVFLLRGIITCAECGKHYQGVTYKNRNDVYSCASKRNINKQLHNTKCNNVNINADIIESEIWNTCKETMINFKDYTKDKIESTISDNELNKLKIKLKGFEEEKNKLLKLFRKSLIDESELEVQIQDINKEKETTQKFYDELYDKEKVKIKSNEMINEYENIFNYYKSRVNELTNKEKMEIIRLLVKEIVVSTEIEEGKACPGITITWNIPYL